MVYVNETTPAVSSMSATSSSQDLHPLDDMVQYLRLYAKERPEMVALACVGIGFILGWRLKPW
ncbi:MAG: hypothetical protein AB7O62_21645 [Pirellulales bacterium]